MESCGSNIIGVNNDVEKKCERNRRCWTAMEERVLVELLKELVAKGGKWSGGFKPGYLIKLEAELIRKLPATDLRATPHINSKIAMWKKQHKSLLKMLREVGVKFNGTTKMVDCNNEAWEKAVEKYPNAVNMRYKPWPYLNDWNEIFGKDRVTGKKKANEPRSSGKKRATVDGNHNDKVFELLEQYRKSSEKRMDIVVRKMEYEANLGKARKEAFSMLDEIPDMSTDEKIDAYQMLLKKTGRVEMFMGLPEDAQAIYVRGLLAGDFGDPI